MLFKKLINIIFLVFLVLLALPTTKQYYFNLGIRWHYILIFSFLLSYLFVPISRWIALRHNIVDKPDWRKLHRDPTPLLGGLAVFIAFIVSLLLNGVFLPSMTALLTGSTLIFIMGLIDDVHPLPALLKLTIQVLIALGVIIAGDIRLTLFFNTPFASFLDIPITLLWIVGITNAMNFFDGVDGLAGALSVVCALFLGLIAFQTNQPALGWFSIALIGACIGFLPYNFRFRKSAVIFLGDASSTFLGFTLAGLAVLGEWSGTSQFVSFTAPVLVFGVLIFDMIYVNLSRIKNRQTGNIFKLVTAANKDHLHHRLLFMSFNHKEVVAVIVTMSVCLGVSALIVMHQDPYQAILALFQAVLILGLIVILMIKGREIAGEINGNSECKEEDKTPSPG